MGKDGLGSVCEGVGGMERTYSKFEESCFGLEGDSGGGVEREDSAVAAAVN